MFLCRVWNGMLLTTMNYDGWPQVQPLSLSAMKMKSEVVSCLIFLNAEGTFGFSTLTSPYVLDFVKGFHFFSYIFQRLLCYQQHYFNATVDR